MAARKGNKAITDKTPDPTTERERIIRKTVNNYHATFTRSPGADVLEDLKRSYFYPSAFNPDPYITAKKLGAREVIEKIMALVDAYEHPEKLRIEVITEDGSP